MFCRSICAKERKSCFAFGQRRMVLKQNTYFFSIAFSRIFPRRNCRLGLSLSPIKFYGQFPRQKKFVFAVHLVLSLAISCTFSHARLFRDLYLKEQNSALVVSLVSLQFFSLRRKGKTRRKEKMRKKMDGKGAHETCLEIKGEREKKRERRKMRVRDAIGHAFAVLGSPLIFCPPFFWTIFCRQASKASTCASCIPRASELV